MQRINYSLWLEVSSDIEMLRMDILAIVSQANGVPPQLVGSDEILLCVIANIAEFAARISVHQQTKRHLGGFLITSFLGNENVAIVKEVLQAESIYLVALRDTSTIGDNGQRSHR